MLQKSNCAVSLIFAAIPLVVILYAMWQGR